MSDYSKNCPVSPEIRRIVHKSFDGPITNEEVLRIQSALRESDDAKRWYTTVAQLHADLAVVKQSEDACRTARMETDNSDFDSQAGTDSQLSSTVSDDSPIADQLIAPSRDSLGIWVSKRLIAVMRGFPMSMAASLLIIGLGLGCGVGLVTAKLVNVAPRFVAMPWRWQVGSDVIAKISTTHRLKWQASESPETLPTQGLREGQQIRIAEGLLELSYRSGVRLILNGPAVFEVRSEHGGKLYSGTASVTAHKDISSFQIETPSGRLQCGPGHYGVEVRPSDEADQSGGAHQPTAVHVFEGLADNVETCLIEQPAGFVTSLKEGDSFEFLNSGQPNRITRATSDRFPTFIPEGEFEVFEGREIPLGNLFDDSKTASLTEAVESDEFQAAGETIDLGVATVHDGGLDMDVSLAENGVYFNFANVGGGDLKSAGYPRTTPIARSNPSQFGPPVKTLMVPGRRINWKKALACVPMSL